jgi:hypothetical protein
MTVNGFSGFFKKTAEWGGQSSAITGSSQNAAAPYLMQIRFASYIIEKIYSFLPSMHIQ